MLASGSPEFILSGGMTGMRDNSSPQKKWLDRVHSQVKWRIDGPNLRNPFDVSASDSKLQEYVLDRLSLMAACTAKAFMDETEIIRITDLDEMKFESVHPNVVNIERQELIDYLKASGTWKFLNTEIDKLQKSCQTEIDSRQSQA